VTDTHASPGEPGGAEWSRAGGGAPIWAAALVVWVLVAAVLLIQDTGAALRGFGDTDDATRMVMVRGLLHGRGWWDQALVRFQPPAGVVMHWSRLLDGALAALDGALSALLGPARGEIAMKLLWPLLLIGPAVASILAIGRRLAGDSRDAAPTILAAAAACAVGLPLYAQFHPGRIDHHNVQILLWLVAWAGASARRPRLGGAIAGLAMGLGLAIGLEALLFYAAIAGFVALRFVWDADERARLRPFALTLLATTLASFLIQTPPVRWDLSVCDALALNLVAGLAVGAAGLVGASFMRGLRLGRAGVIAAAGALAAGVYLGLDPHCLHGPFADVDPAIRPIWLAGVQEMTPVWVLLHRDLPTALALLTAAVMGPLAWLAVGLSVQRESGRWPAAPFWLAGLMLALAVPQACAMLRAASYLYWAATPPLAFAAARAARWLARQGRIDRTRLAMLALLLSPTVEASLALGVLRFAPPAAAAVKGARAAAPDHCFDQASYATLAALPPGRVLAEPDLGPFVIAYTQHSAISAPYHRMGAGLLAGHAAFAAPASSAGSLGAQAKVTALGVGYVLACPAHFGRLAMPKDSLQSALEVHRPPPWLERLSPPRADLLVYRVRLRPSL
jgi:hypothetical protein